MEDVGFDRRAGASLPLQAGDLKSHLPCSLAKSHAWPVLGLSLPEQVLLLSCELEGRARHSHPFCPSASLHLMDFGPRKQPWALGGLPCSATVTLTPCWETPCTNPRPHCRNMPAPRASNTWEFDGLPRPLWAALHGFSHARGP